MTNVRRLARFAAGVTSCATVVWSSLSASAHGSEPPSDSTDVTVTAADSCLPRATLADRTAILGGVTDDGAFWVAGFGEDERGIQMVCLDITFEGQSAANGRIGGPFEAADEPTDMVVALMNVGRAVGPRWYVVRGTVTSDAVRVELSFDGADPVAAELASTGPDDGWLWFALAVPRVGDGTPLVSATAYDAADAPIATGKNLFS